MDVTDLSIPQPPRGVKPIHIEVPFIDSKEELKTSDVIPGLPDWVMPLPVLTMLVVLIVFFYMSTNFA